MTKGFETVFAKALLALPDAPGPNLENHLREVFLEHPDAVEIALDKLISGYQAGRLRSPWGVARAEVSQQIERKSRAAGAGQTQDATARGESWIRTIGSHFDRWSEVEDELFGERGVLFDHRQDAVVRSRLHDFWQQQRPRGEAVEREQIERAEAWKAGRERLAKLRKEVHGPEWKERLDALKKGAVS